MALVGILTQNETGANAWRVRDAAADAGRCGTDPKGPAEVLDGRRVHADRASMWHSASFDQGSSFGHLATMRVVQVVGLPLLFVPINAVA